MKNVLFDISKSKIFKTLVYFNYSKKDYKVNKYCLAPKVKPENKDNKKNLKKLKKNKFKL